jgi:hypothetical protein
MARESFRQDFVLTDYSQSVLRDVESFAKKQGFSIERSHDRLTVASDGFTASSEDFCKAMQKILAKNKSRSIVIARFLPEEGGDALLVGLNRNEVKKRSLREIVMDWRDELVSSCADAQLTEFVLDDVADRARDMGYEVKSAGGVIGIETTDVCPDGFLLDMLAILSLGNCDCVVLTGFQGDGFGGSFSVIDRYVQQVVTVEGLIGEWIDRTWRELSF